MQWKPGMKVIHRAQRGWGVGVVVQIADEGRRVAIRFAGREGIAAERFQLQMLYGIRPKLQLELAARGYAVLVATPYGPDWYRYLMRRLAERPANVLFFLRNLLRR